VVRIVYGVSGEGSGHSSRAREVMTHLLEAGHEVRAASYDRGFANLRDDFDVLEIEGLHIATEENRVSLVETFTHNLARMSEGVRSLKGLRDELFRAWKPEVVITDFEPMSAYLANHYELPLVTIDNQHRMRYMAYPRPEALKRDARLTETVIRALVPKPDVSLVTTFWFGEVKNERTFLFPPILRRSILETRPGEGEHVLVYFTQGFDAFLAHLRDLPDQRFVVYGTGRAGEEGNLRFEAPSREGFRAHLATARAVISTAGFTLMTEALHLGKPLLALPMAGQFEQELNAHLLEASGCGKNGREATRDTVAAFLYDLPRYRRALADYPRADNAALFARLDALLADDAAEARAFHARRRS